MRRMILRKLSDAEPRSVHNGTVIARRLLDKEFQSGITFLEVSTVKPGVTMEPHSHPQEEEIYFVLEGEALVRVGEDEVRASKGDAILIPPRHEHVVTNDGDQDFTILVFSATSLESHQ